MSKTASLFRCLGKTQHLNPISCSPPSTASSARQPYMACSSPWPAACSRPAHAARCRLANAGHEPPLLQCPRRFTFTEPPLQAPRRWASCHWYRPQMTESGKETLQPRRRHAVHLHRWCDRRCIWRDGTRLERCRVSRPSCRESAATCRRPGASRPSSR